MSGVGLVFVSHSADIAAGLVELAAQMAPSATLLAAGGTDDGGIGTSFDAVTAAIAAADSGDGVVVIGDLGSAILTAETALELLDDDALRSRVRVLDVPLVEGGVAAAVAAEAGGSLEAVVAAARSALPGAEVAPVPIAPVPIAPAPMAPVPMASPVTIPPARASVTARLVNPEGLHARPAAELVKLAATFDAAITVNGVDARSLLRLMALGLTAGSDVTIVADGAQASEAVERLGELVRSGFGEA